MERVSCLVYKHFLAQWDFIEAMFHVPSQYNTFMTVVLLSDFNKPVLPIVIYALIKYFLSKHYIVIFAICNVSLSLE